MELSFSVTKKVKKCFSGLTKCDIILFILSLIFVIISIIIWSTFYPVYNSILSDSVVLKQYKDTSLGYASFLYANPPMKNVMKFSFFNVTNPDEVVYYGAKPELIEIGGYGLLESEQKKYVQFSDDQDKMFYQNYKKYIYSTENTDDGFSYKDQVTFPNPVATGTVSTVFGPNSRFSSSAKIITSLAILFLGEYPMISKNIQDVLFEGYNDPLLDIAHSNIFNLVQNIMGNQFVASDILPEMTRFAYMSGYNNTYDENFWVNTGKKDRSQIGKVESWAGLTELPESFWPTKEARQIKGSDSGSLCKTHLQDSDELPFFLSFMCRSFTKKYLKSSVVDGIKTMLFSVPSEDFDTTLPENMGFRYKNTENVDYFPEWNGCSNGSVEESQCRKNKIINGTYQLPPGMFPLVCYPGHTNQPPFTVIISPPHFAYSPECVKTKFSGITPDDEKDRPFDFYQEKVSGSAIQVDVRLQVNMPVVNNKDTILTSQLPNVLIPLLSQNAHARVSDFVINQVWLGIILAPRIVDYVKFTLLFIGILIFAIFLILKIRRKYPLELLKL